MGITVRLKNVRLAFAHQLFTPSAFEEGQIKKFGCDAILVPGSGVEKKTGVDEAGRATWAPTTMEAVLLEVANEVTKGKGATWLAGLENSKKCYRNGDLRTTPGGDVYDGYEGCWYVTAKNKARPTLLDERKRPLTEADGKPYSGCYATVTVDVYPMTEAKKKGVHGALKGVQFLRDGDAFGGGGVASPDDFEDVTEGADASDLV